MRTASGATRFPLPAGSGFMSKRKGLSPEQRAKRLVLYWGNMRNWCNRSCNAECDVITPRDQKDLEEAVARAIRRAEKRQPVQQLLHESGCGCRVIPDKDCPAHAAYWQGVSDEREASNSELPAVPQP